SGTPESRTAFYEEVLKRVTGLPGVEAAGEVDALFEWQGGNNLGLRAVEGRLPEPIDRWSPLSWAASRRDYLQALGSALLRGRYFTTEEGPPSPLVAIIDESMARRYWPGEDPVGKRFKGQDPRGQNDDWLTVVGVVGDMRRSGLERSPTPHVFQPCQQSLDPDRTGSLVVRLRGDAPVTAAALRVSVRSVCSTAWLSVMSTLKVLLRDKYMPRSNE